MRTTNEASMEDFTPLGFEKHGKAICILNKLTLGLLLLSILILMVLTAVTTYFVTRDAFDNSECIVIETTSTSPTTTPMITTTPVPTEAPLPDGVRLNKTVIPMYYNVELQPYLYEGDDFSFNGRVIMWLR